MWNSVFLADDPRSSFPQNKGEVVIFYATFETFFTFIHQGPSTLIKNDSEDTIYMISEGSCETKDWSKGCPYSSYNYFNDKMLYFTKSLFYLFIILIKPKNNKIILVWSNMSVVHVCLFPHCMDLLPMRIWWTWRFLLRFSFTVTFWQQKHFTLIK